MSEELPDGWAEIEFERIIKELRNGISTKPSLESPGIPILRISSVRPGSVSLDDRRFIPEGEKLIDTYGLRDRDLLFTRYNGSLELLGVCGMVRGLGGKSLLYPDKLMRVRLDESIALPEYVELFFQSPKARDAIMAIAKSSAGQQGVSGADLKQQKIALAPLAEQRRIVAKVEALLAQVNAARERLSKVPLILKRFRQTVLTAACSGKLTEEWRSRQLAQSPASLADADLNDLPRISEPPETWRLVPLEAVAERFQYGTSDKADANESTGVPVLRMGNIQDGKIDLSDLKYISKEKVPDEFLLQMGDILFNRTNSPELVGKTAVVNQSEPMAFASYLIRVQVNRSLVRPLFVSWWLNSAWGRQWARHVRTDGVSQSNINSTKLAAMPLPLPPLAEQDEAIRVGGQLLALADAVEQRLNPAVTRVERTTQRILAKAVSGQLVPTESEVAYAEGRSFETAEQLLARVKGELKESLGTSKGRGRRLKEASS